MYINIQCKNIVKLVVKAMIDFLISALKLKIIVLRICQVWSKGKA